MSEKQKEMSLRVGKSRFSTPLLAGNGIALRGLLRGDW